MIFFRTSPVLGVDLREAINTAVFPGLQVSTTPPLAPPPLPLGSSQMTCENGPLPFSYSLFLYFHL